MMLKLERKNENCLFGKHLVAFKLRQGVFFIYQKLLERGDHMPGPESQTKQINERREECDDHPELRLN